MARQMPEYTFCEIKWKDDGATITLDVDYYW
jgi:hypothetical protein